MNRSRRFGRVGAGLVSLTLAVGGAVAFAAPASAAGTVHGCNYMDWYYDDGYYFVPVPMFTDGVTSSWCWQAKGDSSRGWTIADIQKALNLCNGASLVTDGIYGEKTRQAVIAVQRKAGLTQDGVYGPATMRAMSWPRYRLVDGWPRSGCWHM
jgi:hypothetical protein